VRRGRVLFPDRVAIALAAFTCVVAPLTLVTLQIDSNTKFSPVDEAAHFDYVNRVSDGELPRQGEPLLESTLRELACRGIEFAQGRRVPPCSTRQLRPEQFSTGSQYEAQQPPTYYALTVPLRFVEQKALGVSDRLRATRLANIVWLSAGLLLLWAAGRIMGIAPFPLASGLLLLASAPEVIYTTGIVSNDATAIPSAGLVALAAALLHQREGRIVPTALFLAGFAAGAGKATNMFAVVAVSALLAVGALTGRDRAERWTATARSWLRDGGALLIGGLLAVALWAIVHRSRSLVDLSEDPSFDLLRQAPRTVGMVVREPVQLFQPLTGFGSGGFGALSKDTLGGEPQAPFDALASFLLMAAALAGLFVSPRRWQHALGLTSVVVAYLGGVALAVSLILTFDVDPGLSGRYSLSLAALLTLVLAASVAGRWAERSLGVFAGASFATTVIVMIT
jgi:hypothetical protein